MREGGLNYQKSIDFYQYELSINCWALYTISRISILKILGTKHSISQKKPAL